MSTVSSSKRVAIIGGGPAGLMAAERLAAAGLAVTIYDRMPSVGRKFLMAGRGGLNLTHGEDQERFFGRYGKACEHLRGPLEALPPQSLRSWSAGLGQETYVGSSGRVFPRAFKASPLLRAWLRRLESLRVDFALRHTWQGWDAAGDLRFTVGVGKTLTVRPDATVLALGGASWPRLGSDGAWVEWLEARGVAVSPLRPANMGVNVPWSDVMRERFEGQPLKNFGFRCGSTSARGEAVVTADGLEGGAIYALPAPLRDRIERDGEATLSVDLRPDLSLEELTGRLSSPRRSQSTSTFLRKAAGLKPLSVALLRETSPSLPSEPETLGRLIKGVPLRATGLKPTDRAISTAGGVAFAELDQNLMLRRMPGVFVAGEMLDWEAPTGGYLLQAAFATGNAAASGVLDFLQIRDVALTESDRSATPDP